MVRSPGLGRIAFAHMAATLPGVSAPSSVVRSMQRIARSSAHSLEDFLIDRLASDAARSSAPTSSTLRTPRMSEPRWVSERAVAMGRLCDGGVRRPTTVRSVGFRAALIPAFRDSRALWLGVAWLLVGCGGGGTAAATTPTPMPPSVTFSPLVTPIPQPAQRQEPSLPVPIEEAGAATAGGNLYVIGGFNVAGASLDSVYVFDGSTWRAGPRLPLPVDHPSAATLDGQVYLAGGHSNGRDSARVVTWLSRAARTRAKPGSSTSSRATRPAARGAPPRGCSSRGTVSSWPSSRVGRGHAAAGARLAFTRWRRAPRSPVLQALREDGERAMPAVTRMINSGTP